MVKLPRPDMVQDVLIFKNAPFDAHLSMVGDNGTGIDERIKEPMLARCKKFKINYSMIINQKPNSKELQSSGLQAGTSCLYC